MIPFVEHPDMAERSISERLANWGASLQPQDLPSAMHEKAELVLLDVVGLCLAARRTDYVASTLASGESGGHVAIGHARRLTAADAALVNGTAAHGEDFDDTFEGGPVHSGAVIAPAVLAAAERDDLPPERILVGLAAGLELLCRLGLTAPKAIHKAGFHPTAVLGSLAAAFAVGVATNCRADDLKQAVGIAGSTASGIIEYLGDGSWTKRMHAGWAAQAGMRAAYLGKAGFVGPRAVLEGEHGFFKAFAPSIEPLFDNLLGDLGRSWVAERITFKPYPCGTMVQPYIDCAAHLLRDGLNPSRVRSVHCRTSEGYVHRLWEPLEMKRNPPTDYAAKFSVPFGIALGLVRGRAGLADFSPESIRDEDLLRVSRLVSYEIDPDDPYPARFTGNLTVELDDGSLREARQDHMRGGVDAPLTRDDVEAKFWANARYGGIAAPERLLDTCRAILAGRGAAAIKGLAVKESGA
jgi:2-methylcitrate dehydratase PrpD